MKPNPQGILLALKRLNAMYFVFIGNHINDSKAAERAGGKSIIVNRNPSKKLGFYADYVVGSLMEVPRLIQHINNII